MKAAEDIVVLKTGLRVAGWEEMNAQIAEVAKLQEQLAVTVAELLQLLAKYGGLSDGLRVVRLQPAAGTTVSANLKSAAGRCERFAQSAKMTRPCKESSTTASKAAFSALLTERDDLKNCCEASTLENQRTSKYASETKELRRKLADRELTKALAKVTQKGRGRRHATAACMQVIALVTLLAEAKKARAQLVDISTQSETDVGKARADPESCRVRPGKVKQSSKITSAILDDA